MLAKLTPRQISAYWEPIKFAISRSLPPTAEFSHDGMVEVFKALLADRMQAWAMIDSEYKIKAILTTVLSRDLGTQKYNLVIYSAFAVGKAKVSVDEWKQAVETLVEFAKKAGAKKLLAYTNVPRVVEVAKALGARIDFKLLSMEVK